MWPPEPFAFPPLSWAQHTNLAYDRKFPTSGKRVTSWISDLKGLTNLSKLYLAGTAGTDAGVKELKGLQLLTLLSVPRTKVTAAGVAEMKAALPKCQVVN